MKATLLGRFSIPPAGLLPFSRRAVLADCPPFGCIVVRRAGGRFDYYATGRDTTGPDPTRPDETRLDATRHDGTRLDKTGPDTTRLD